MVFSTGSILHTRTCHDADFDLTLIKRKANCDKAAREHESLMRHEDRDQIKKLSLFRDMPEAAIDRLLAGCYLQRFPAHVVLISEGEPADFLHIVIEGGVELFSTWRDRETTMSIARPVSTFILAAVIKDAPYLMSARTLQPSSILMIPSGNIRAMMAEDRVFGAAMVNELSASFREVVKSQKNVKLRSGVERLANYLLQLSETHDRCAELPIEKKTLASLLGMSPENLSRAFASLKAYGVVVNGGSVTLTQPGDLERLAKPNNLIDDPQS